MGNFANDLKLTISMNGSGFISVRIKDASSGLPIVEAEVDPASFAEALTGLAFSAATATFMPNDYTVQRYGMVRVTERVQCRKPGSSENIRDVVNADFAENWAPSNWEIQDYGDTSQQRGEKHTYIIRKFITQAEANKKAGNFRL